MTEHRQIRRLANLSAEVDTSRPNSARMYDYFLGGAANFAPDREAAEQSAAAFPNIRLCVRVNRAFLGRAVRYLSRHGIDQFLDLGSGIPTVGNVHEIAHQHNPAAKVAYVDYEPVAVARAQRLLAGEPHVTISRADIRNAGDVLSAPGVAGLLDFGRPVAIMAVAILHFVPESQNPRDILATYRNACVPGSSLAVSHVSQVTLSDAQVNRFLAAYRRTPTPGVFRNVDEIRALLAGYQLVEPGLVLLPHWQPEEPWDEQDAAESNLYGAVGFLPGSGYRSTPTAQ